MTPQPSQAVILGIDAGTAHTGMGAILIDEAGRAFPHWCGFVKTKADDRGVRRQGRALDDQRRLYEVIDPILHAIGTMRPSKVAYEEYTTHDSVEVNKAKKLTKVMLSDAADYGIIPTDTGRRHPQAPPAECLKVLEPHLVAVRGALGAGNQFVGVRGKGRAARTLTVVGAIMTACRIYQVEAVPQYASQLKARFPGGGKEGTMTAVRSILPGTTEMLTKCGIAPSDHNHVFDAWGHAILAAGL